MRLARVNAALTPEKADRIAPREQGGELRRKRARSARTRVGCPCGRPLLVRQVCKYVSSRPYRPSKVELEPPSIFQREALREKLSNITHNCSKSYTSDEENTREIRAVPTADTQQCPDNVLQISRVASTGAFGRGRRCDATNGARVNSGDSRAGPAYASDGGYDHRRAIRCVLVSHREISKETGTGQVGPAGGDTCD